MTSEIDLRTARGTVLLDKKIFDIKRLNFVKFDDIIRCVVGHPGVEFEYFFSNISETEWGYIRVREGKLKEWIPLLEWPVKYVIPVAGYTEGYVVGYTQPRNRKAFEKFISVTDLNRNHLLGYFAIAPPGSKKHRDLCLNLIRTIIRNKAKDCAPGSRIEIGQRQGLRITSTGKARFEAKNRYRPVLHPYLPRSILHCENALAFGYPQPDGYSLQLFSSFFNGKDDLRLLNHLRVTSFHMKLAHECGLDFDLLPIVITSETVTTEMAVTILKNDTVRSSDVLTLSGNLQSMKEQLSERNDAVLIVVDDSKTDETQRRRKGLELLESRIIAKSSDNHFIPVLLSNHAILEVQPELSCPLFLSDYEYAQEPSCLRRLLQRFDASLIDGIEKNYAEYAKLFRQKYYEVAHAVPKTIPRHRHQVYICLISVARTYDAFFPPLFGPETERFVEAWLSDVCEEPCSLGDELFRHFGAALNAAIATGRFRFIQRTKFITFEKGTDSVIVDDDYVYFETSVIRTLATEKMGLHSVNTLTDMLKENDCLIINDHHSKSYRFIIQGSDKVYTYGISKLLINAANHRLLNLAGKSDFLLTQTEFERYELLPLGVVANGRFIGKDISFSSKSNNHVFITGRSGRGKTFFTHNLLPSIAMLGGNMIVIDASGSSPREEVLRSLPPVVVDAVFDFINVSPGQAKMPVNPLYIGDCYNLAAKKRRIVGFVKSAAGKLSPEDSRVIAGLISQRLQGHDEITVFTPEMLRKTLEKGGPAGRNALNLIESVLSDIEAIGCEEQGWGTFFAKHKRIPVILIDDAVGENVHQLVDVLLNSLFEWQHDHAEQPLTITVDEIKRMSFRDGSPLHTIMTQGRRYRIRLIGITQDYVSNDSHAIDVMKQAGTQVFFEPAKSHDRIAKELEYKDAADAGLSSMGIGECIIRSDFYNMKDGCNTKAVIPCSTVKFVDLPLYARFKRAYQIADPQENTAESRAPYEVSQPERVEVPADETVSEVQELSTTALAIPAPDETESAPSEVKVQQSLMSESADDVPAEESAAEEAVPEEDSSETVKPEHMEIPMLESTEDEPAEIILDIGKSPMPLKAKPVMTEDTEQERIERELQKQFQDLKHRFSPDHPCWASDLDEFFERFMREHHFSSTADRDKLKNCLDSFLLISQECSDYRERLETLYQGIWPNT